MVMLLKATVDRLASVFMDLLWSWCMFSYFWFPANADNSFCSSVLQKLWNYTQNNCAVQCNFLLLITLFLDIIFGAFVIATFVFGIIRIAMTSDSRQRWALLVVLPLQVSQSVTSVCYLHAHSQSHFIFTWINSMSPDRSLEILENAGIVLYMPVNLLT